MIYITLKSNTVPVQYANFVREGLKRDSKAILLLTSHFLRNFFHAYTIILSVKTAVKMQNIWRVLTVKKLSRESSIKSHQFVMKDLSVGNGLFCIRISNNFIVGKDCQPGSDEFH